MNRAIFAACLTLGIVQMAATDRVTVHSDPKQDILELDVHPEDVRDGVPQIFTITLRNKSDHEIRIPEPALKCNDMLVGGLVLFPSFTPPPPNNIGSARGYCASGVDHYPGIAIRIKDWHSLPAGGLLLYHISLSSLKFDTSEPGTYDFRVWYYPPHLSESEVKVLGAMSVDYPRLSITSPNFSYEKH